VNSPRHFPLRRAGRLLAAATMFVGIIAATSATTVPKLDLAEMVRRADAIVIGHARSAESVWFGRELYTRYRIEVQEQLLGPAAAEVHVVVPGGVDRNRRHPIAVTIADAPAFHSGEHVALFLERGTALGESDFSIVGFNQGRVALDDPASRATAVGGGTATSEAGASARRVARLKQRLQPMIHARSPAGAHPVARPEAPRGHTEVLGGGR
jgi:hypothetical protein